MAKNRFAILGRIIPIHVLNPILLLKTHSQREKPRSKCEQRRRDVVCLPYVFVRSTHTHTNKQVTSPFQLLCGKPSHCGPVRELVMSVKDVYDTKNLLSVVVPRSAYLLHGSTSVVCYATLEETLLLV